MDYTSGLISIITPVYNSADLIQSTIDSIQQQTYPQWELILVNDASQDDSLAICQTYADADERIKVIDLPVNQGAAVARNTGLEQAQGEYIAFVDSDDVWAPEKLERQLKFMQEHHYGFTYTGLARMNLSGEIIQDSVPIPLKTSYRQLLKNTAIACSTVMINRQIVGDFRMPNLRRGQDTATWLMLMRERNIEAYGLDKVLNYYRQVPGSISSNRWTALKRTWHLYRNVEKLPLFQAIYYFIWYGFNAVRRRL